MSEYQPKPEHFAAMARFHKAAADFYAKNGNAANAKAAAKLAKQSSAKARQA
jgi:hypothetical protein